MRREYRHLIKRPAASKMLGKNGGQSKAFGCDSRVAGERQLVFEWQPPGAAARQILLKVGVIAPQSPGQAGAAQVRPRCKQGAQTVAEILLPSSPAVMGKA